KVVPSLGPDPRWSDILHGERGPAMPWADLHGLTLYYEEQGQPEAPPLLLLHPFLATNAYWSPHLAAFGARYRLIVPDLRGHGWTDCPGGLASMNHHQFARDIIALCEHLG